MTQQAIAHHTTWLWSQGSEEGFHLLWAASDQQGSCWQASLSLIQPASAALGLRTCICALVCLPGLRQTPYPLKDRFAAGEAAGCGASWAGPAVWQSP